MHSKTVKYARGGQTPPELAIRLAPEIRGALAIVDYEYARRRYEWSKRLNLVALGVCAAVGAAALIWGFLRYQDWQWLDQHFSGGGSTRWSPGVISGYFTSAITAMVTGILGFVTFFIGFFYIRPALDEDKVDAVKRWSLVAGITGILPGFVFGGLLELFIWRAHAAESFNMFGLLGAAPQPVPSQSVAAAPMYNPAAEEVKRKAEYDALFTSQQAPAAPAPDYGYGYPNQAPAYDYSQAPAAPAPADYGYGPAAAAAAPAADTGAQYQQQPSGAPICTCGRPMEWVPEYNRYYCYTDDKYEGET